MCETICRKAYESMEKQERVITEDTKYIQQHLANERMFLAWIRTAIAITGIGFLIINLHMKSSLHSLPNTTVQGIGMLSVLTGICTIIFFNHQLFPKGKTN
jgi:putative membrane protein